MSRRKQSNRHNDARRKREIQVTAPQEQNALSRSARLVCPEGELFTKESFMAIPNGTQNSLSAQALIWSWQETKYVTDAFDYTQEICDDLGLKDTAKSYTSMMNALQRYRDVCGGSFAKAISNLG